MIGKESWIEKTIYIRKQNISCESNSIYVKLNCRIGWSAYFIDGQKAI